MFILMFLVFSFINTSLENQVDIHDEFNILTINLIENLRVDPVLNGESLSRNLSETSKEFIDKHIHQYSELVLTSQPKEFSRSKRNLSKRDAKEGLGDSQDYITDISPYGNYSSFPAKDVVFFRQNSNWYLVSIEKKTKEAQYYELLIVRKYKDEKFSTLKEEVIQNGIKAASFPLENSTIIVIAENKVGLNYTKVYELNWKEELNVILKLNGSEYRDVAIWEDNSNVFMSLVGFMGKSPGSSSSSRLYKWRGRHFDTFQDIQEGATRITPFSIADLGYLAIARNVPVDGEENIYSEILKYNVETDKYELFRKILTYACEDIKYVEIDGMGATPDKEGFLIVGNLYAKDASGNINYDAVSIVYKFIDDYFIPLQTIPVKGVRQWETVTDKSGNVLLLALTTDGVRAFQYNGWQFTESTIHFKEEFRNTQDINTIHSYRIEEKDLIVAARENPEEYQHLLFEVTFSTQNELEKLHDELFSWCHDQTKIISDRNEDILGKTRRGDMDDELESESLTEATDFEKLMSNLNKHSKKVTKIEEALKNSLQSLEHHTINRDLAAKRIHFNSTAKTKSISVEKINNLNIVTILNNALNINEGFQINTDVKIQFMRTEEDVEPKTFNGHPTESIIYKNEDKTLKHIKVNGSVTFKDEVTIGHLSGSIKINAENILLKSGDQNLGNLRATDIQADKVNTDTINGHPVDASQEIDSSQGKQKVTSVKSLKTKNLVVEGLLNDLYFPTLAKYALRKSGKQDITAETYYFDRVESELLETDRLSDTKIPKDLLVINKGNYIVPKSLMFSEILTVNSLTAVQHLDSISVNQQGTLDLLLKNVTVQQYVPSLKTLDNLEVLHPINIRGKLKGFDKFEPLRKLTKDLTVKTDVRVTGNVVIENLLKSKDIVSETPDTVQKLNASSKEILDKHPRTTIKNVTESSAISESLDKPRDHLLKKDGTYSMVRAVTHGIRLKDENINVPVTFLEHITVPEIEADQINNFNPENWVITGAKLPQVIKGWKTFEGDLLITGDTDISRINNIETKELVDNVLKTDGNQIVRGKHHAKHVIILNSLKTNITKFGKHPWKEVITTTGHQTINYTLKLNDLSVSSATVKNINTNGLINGINFTNIMEDAVFKDTPRKVFGTKTFENLSVKHLTNSNFDVKQKLKEVEDKNIVLDNIKLIPNITAERIYVNNNVNGINKSKLNTTRSMEDDVWIVEGDHHFDSILVHGNVDLESNRLNNIDLDELRNNSVKIDEPFFFEYAEFARAVTTSSISLKGEIEKFDLDNVFENGKNETQVLLDKIVFRNDVSVQGTVNIKGDLNGVKLEDLCGLTSKYEGPKKLVIEGDVHFAKGPLVARFNGVSEKDLNNNIWYTDRPVTLHGNVVFDGNVSMRGHLNVQGLLNGIRVDLFSTNYFSKTKDQKIPAHMNFANTTTFIRDVITQNISIGSQLNDINFNEFVKTVLLHRAQLFEDVVYFEEITTKYLEGDYLVNKLNLDSEVMRYDRPNLITGPKSFGNLEVDFLRPDGKSATVQDVDVDQWLAGAVLNEGYHKVGGRKRFANVEVVNGTSIIGTFNGFKLDKENVLLKKTPQNITGVKNFVPEYPNELKFKALKLRGLLNNDDFSKLIDNQAHINGNSTFKTTLAFNNNILANNLIFEKKYDDIDIKELLHNISNLGTFTHIKEKYNNLINMIQQVEKSLQDQAFYLDYFKSLPPTFNATDIFTITCGENDNRIVSFENQNKSIVMSFLEWNEKLENFKPCCSKKLGPYRNYINKVKIDGKDLVYLEHRTKSEKEDNTHTGQMMMCNNGSIQLYGKFLTKGTIFITSFTIKSLNWQCLLFVDFNFNINIPCSEPGQEFHNRQTIKNKHPVLASVVTENDVPYIVTIHKEDEGKTVVWRLNKALKKFEEYQTVHEGTPISVSTISSNEGTFLAVAYQQLPNTKDFGKIIIRRFNTHSKTFKMFQKIKVHTPTQILFSLLPSEEIALYISTSSPSEPFTAYLYEGVAKFVRKIGSTTIPKSLGIKDITLRNRHFVLVGHDKDLNVLQGVFKGNKIEKKIKLGKV